MLWLLITILLQDPTSLQQALRAEEPIIQPQTERLEAIKALSRELATEQHEKPKLYVSITSHCEPCERAKRDIEAGVFSEFEVIYCPMPDDWSEGYPVLRWKTESGWRYVRDVKTKQNRGYDATVRDFIKGRTKTTTKTVVQTAATIVQPARMSHSDMVRLHNQLHGGGAWTWSGDLRTHLRNSHGVEVPE